MSPLLADLIDKGGHLLVDHETVDAQHGGVALAELGSTLGEHDLLVEDVLAKVNVAGMQVVQKLVAIVNDTQPCC